MITAASILNYSVSINGNGVSKNVDFTQNVEISDLEAGVYEVCFTVSGVSAADFNRCYDILITEPSDLSVLSKIEKDKKSISLKLANAKEYVIDINGTIIRTTESDINLPLSKGLNTINITTDIFCQGSFSKSVFVSEDTVVYPNPFKDYFFMNIGNDASKVVKVNVYSSTGKLVQSRYLTVKSRTIMVDGTHFSKGVYTVNVELLNGMSNFKIIKQ